MECSRGTWPQFPLACQAAHNSVYAFTHYLVHSLFRWELGQLVFIAKKGV